MSTPAVPILVAPIGTSDVVQVPVTTGFVVPVTGAHLVDNTGRLHVLQGTNLPHVQRGGVPVVHDGLTYVPTHHIVNTAQPTVYRGSGTPVSYTTPGSHTSYPPSSSSVRHTAYLPASSSVPHETQPPTSFSSSSKKSVVHGDQVGHKGHRLEYKPSYKASGRFQFGGNKTIINQTVVQHPEASHSSSKTSHSSGSSPSSSLKASHSKPSSKTPHSSGSTHSSTSSPKPSSSKIPHSSTSSPKPSSSSKTPHASGSKPSSSKTPHVSGPKPSKAPHAPSSKPSSSLKKPPRPSGQKTSRRKPSSLKPARTSATGGNHTVKKKRPASVRARISEKFVLDAYKEKYTKYFGAGTPRDVFYAAVSTVERARTNPGTFFFPSLLDSVAKNGNILECLIEFESSEQKEAKLVSRRGYQLSSRTLEFFFWPTLRTYCFSGQIITFAFSEKAFVSFDHDQDEQGDYLQDVNPGSEYSRFNIFLAREEDTDGWKKDSLYTVRVNLYDDVIEREAAENVPVAYMTLEFTRTDSLHVYDLSSLVVTLDFEPTNAEVVVNTRGIDVLPSLTNESIYVAERSNYQGAAQLHNDILEKISDAYKEITDTPKRNSFWCFKSNHGSASSKPAAVDKCRVLWGDIFDTVLCFVTGVFLKEEGLLESLHDPEFFRETISRIPDGGSVLVAEIERIYKSFYERTPEQRIKHTFPSLYQVLRHTTGLPRVPYFDVSRVYDEYNRITHAIASGESLDSPDYHEQQVRSFGTLLESLQYTLYAESAVDTIVSDSGGYCEALLLHAFFIGLAKTSPLNYAFERMSEMFAVHLSSILGQHADLMRPTALSTNMIISSFNDLVSYVDKLYTANIRGDVSSFTLSDMLTRPTYYQPDTILAKAFGWSCIRARNNIDVFFASSAQYIDLDNTLVVFIPRLDFWAVFHENVTVDGASLVMNSFDTLEKIVSVVEKISLTPEIVQSIDYLAQSVYARHHEVITFNEHKIDTTMEYFDIFLNPITNLPTELDLVTDELGAPAIRIGTNKKVIIPLVNAGGMYSYYRGDNAYSTDEIALNNGYIRFGGHLFLPKTYYSDLQRNFEHAKRQRDQSERKNIHTARAAKASAQSIESSLACIDMQKMFAGQAYLQASRTEHRVPQHIGGPLGLGLGLATGALAGAALTGVALGGPGYRYYPYAAWDGMLYAPNYGYYFPWGSPYYYNAPVFVGHPRTGIAYGGRRRFYGGRGAGGGFHGGHGGRGGGHH